MIRIGCAIKKCCGVTTCMFQGGVSLLRGDSESAEVSMLPAITLSSWYHLDHEVQRLHKVIMVNMSIDE